MQPPRRYSTSEYVLLTDGDEQEYYDEACDCDHKSEWLKAMQEEVKSLHENHTYDLTKLLLVKLCKINGVPLEA